MRRVQLQGGARGPHARRTPCTFHSEGGFAPLPKPPPRIRCAGKAGARKWNTLPSRASNGSEIVPPSSRWSASSAGFARAIDSLGEVSEGAAEALSDGTPQMGPYHRSRARTMEGSGYDNVLRRRLGQGQFVASIEFVTPAAHEPFETAFAPITELAARIKADARFDTIALTDRVKSDHDHDPVRVAAHVAEACGKAPLVHLSGKDRDASRVADSLRRMQGTGLENVLVVTGDKVRT